MSDIQTLVRTLQNTFSQIEEIVDHSTAEENIIQSSKIIPEDFTQEQIIKSQKITCAKLHKIYTERADIIQKQTEIEESIIQFQTLFVEFLKKSKTQNDKLSKQIENLVNETKESEKKLLGDQFTSEYEKSEYEKYSKLKETRIPIGQKSTVITTTSVKRSDSKAKTKSPISFKKKSPSRDTTPDPVYEKSKSVPVFSQSPVLPSPISEEHFTEGEYCERRFCSIKGKLFKNQMQMCEKEMNRFCNWIIFDSTRDKWDNLKCTFNQIVKGRSHLLFVFEIDEGRKIGCYIDQMIKDEGKYNSGTQSFLFRCDGNGIEKYPLKEGSKVFKLFSEKEEDLFVVGKGDLLIKKEEKKAMCSCKQKSYEYNGKENVLTGKGMFELKKFVVISTIDMNERQQMEAMFNLPISKIKQLEEWITMQCSEVLFDTDVDAWAKDTSVLNDRISGKKHIVLLVETDEHEKFGYYLFTECKQKFGKLSETNKMSFQFNLESNGRLNLPMKFEIKHTYTGGYFLHDKSSDGLIQMGDIALYKEGRKNDSFVIQNDVNFDYHDIRKAMNGKQSDVHGRMKFNLKRVMIIQMK